MSQRLWIATGNAKKKLELLRLLEPLGFELLGLDEAPPIEIVEDAPDFAGNAAKKAVPLALATGELALGDDSGLAVDALGGEPGVRSARWAGPDATDADRIAKLLGALERLPDRRARFVCHLCLAAPGPSGVEVVWTTEQTCEGEILNEPRGLGGFGYDPAFAPIEQSGERTGLVSERSFAEMTPEEKDALSHRGKALRELVAHLSAHPSGRP